ncbi:acyltransferase [Azorhizobium oxalatiphilum]|uniref:Acyltransferase n=1 Tax=Azorhizobium oxalatiphilum TaxID=980631 RepID=A0A917BP75_9HYPH|nr:acyltransferase [Azorhizobium oxalatiphilum]GGF53852.1 acyltransferase [Azorhizobium oxalatiphilum]
MARFESLDAWRGVCALLVVLFHFCFIFVSPLTDVRLVSNAYLFVDFFFVLSGFVVCHAYRDRLGDGGRWLGFVVRRFGRLWPLHAALLAAFAVFIGVVNLLPHPERFTLAWADGEYSVLGMGAYALLLNAVNLHGMAWNAPSWSIGAEFYTYLLFGAVCVLTRGRLSLVAGLLALASIGLLALVSPTYMNSTADFGLFRCIAGFFTGIVAYRVHEVLVSQLKPLGVGAATVLEIAAVALVVLFVAKSSHGPDAVRAISLAAPVMFAAAVLVFAQEGGLVSRLLRAKPFAALGRWSYSIYMGHHLVLMATLYGVWAFSRWQGVSLETQVLIGGHPKTLYAVGGTSGSTLLLAGMLAVVIAMAAFTYARVEEPARRAFNGIAKRLETRQAIGSGRVQASASRASSAS